MMQKGGIGIFYSSAEDSLSGSDNTDSDYDSDDMEHRSLLRGVLLGGGHGSEQAAVPTTTKPQPEQVQQAGNWYDGLLTVFTLFFPFLLLIVGVFFISLGLSAYKFPCNWPLWLFYISVGSAISMLCFVSCTFAYTKLTGSGGPPVLSVSKRKQQQLFDEHAHAKIPRMLEFKSFRNLVEELILHSTSNVSREDVLAEFAAFDKYQHGGMVPIAEVQACIEQLSRGRCQAIMVQAAFVTVDVILLGALMYGSLFAAHSHNTTSHNTCDRSLLHNVETSLLGLWAFFGLYTAAIVHYFYTLYKPVSHKREQRGEYEALGEDLEPNAMATTEP
mmetsp:Transcript_28589/g.56180  ORF Transcript_28589/g.56180 Transcript_28589/m.56180 type:complete len:331 (+) Transcript_28589:72-1064(+)|eukprot:CAMPEP_0175140298 /NCGR_PEP_ID=MMETSP0087-20121206/11390_1 /TAXON_ID=136419 /ORGANISM="Unknown Unknown, Strain D1" /LENGTH=330 /DNA_ID=CAMNT_0016423423 /DNA_START=69 /DNA_END=1061 /DNA_ORIENTATION=-